ncbi:uncharacterized protein LOC143453213 [Clavelina lepadiformis]|uniref:uncharacterized protein LOC143453213 n=1 Tax=Clavelina lepadiformis TaxID=159417 RepID=UPI0040419569
MDTKAVGFLPAEVQSLIFEELKLIREEWKLQIKQIEVKLDSLLEQNNTKQNIEDVLVGIEAESKTVSPDISELYFNMCPDENVLTLNGDKKVIDIIDLTDCLDDIEVPQLPSTSSLGGEVGEDEISMQCQETDESESEEEMEKNNDETETFEFSALIYDHVDGGEMNETSPVDNEDSHSVPKTDTSTITKALVVEYGVVITNSVTGKTIFQCTLCDKRFASRRTLKQHNMVHTEERPFTCTYCSKTFRRRSHLACHERTHTGEKPYKCAICGKSYSEKVVLTRHMELHKNDPAYSDLPEFHVSMPGNAGRRCYVCDICDKTFNHQAHAITHLRTHTGERPFKCQFCDKAFQRNSHRNRHERIHTGEKPYKCKICDRRFADSSGLRNHSLRMHSQPCNPN